MIRTLLPTFVVLVLLSSCVEELPRQGTPKGSATPVRVRAAVGSKPPPQPAPAKESSCGGAGRCGASTGGHTCADSSGTPDRVVRRKRADGKTVVKAGGAFGRAPRVAIEELLAVPARYRGKRVALQGKVAAMCHHRRGWFALALPSGAFVRVVTVPKFLVPAGVIGQTARTEGVVEVREVSAAAARHYASGHKLGDARKIAGAVKRVIVRAHVAEFVP